MNGLAQNYEWYIIKLWQKQAFEFGCADGASQGTRSGSHVYETNTLMWNFGRSQPQIDGFLVAKTETIRRKFKSEVSRRAKNTRQARKRAAAERGRVKLTNMTCTYLAYTCHM
jgi:hypothetical protein